VLQWAGELGRARALLEEAAREAREEGGEEALGLVLYHLSELGCWAGDWDQAEADAAEGLFAAELAGQENLRSVLLYTRALIDALIELGDLASAKTVIDWLEERAVAVDRPWALAVAARGRGKLLASSGELDDGVAELERAVRLHDRVSEPFELARTLLALGSL